MISALRLPAEMPTVLPSVPLHADMHIASCWRPARNQPRRLPQFPIALAASQCPTPGGLMSYGTEIAESMSWLSGATRSCFSAMLLMR
jgi:hypothetical protein